MTQKLPLFKGYTVDVKLKQFRRVDKEAILFIDFDSPKGEKLLEEYIDYLDPESPELEALLDAL